MEEDAAALHVVDVADGLRLLVSSLGAGPPVVMLHGFTGSVASWDALRLALRGRVRTVAIDLPGHGRSSAPRDPARHALPRVANDVARVLDALALERVTLLGYSMGGRTALHVALAHPERLSALVLESTSPGIADAGERASRRESDAALARRIEEAGLAAFVDEWERLPLWEGQRLAPAVAAAQRAARLANDPHGLAASLRGAGAGAQEPLHARLATVAVRTLLVAGERDTRYVATAHAMAAAIPGARLAIVPDAGHAVHLERPAELAAVLLEFLHGR